MGNSSKTAPSLLCVSNDSNSLREDEQKNREDVNLESVGVQHRRGVKENVCVKD